MRFLPVALLLLLAGCATLPAALPPAGLAPAKAAPDYAAGDYRARARGFVEVARQVGPAAEDACRRNAPQMGCTLRIVVDDQNDLGANAYQTLDKEGRPLIAVTPALIGEVRNADEIAFILSHEAAHHIGGHLQKANSNAAIGAQTWGGWASRIGGSEQVLRAAASIGAALGARVYSKDFELEADQIGTFITAEAGYNPLNGARFFERLPEPTGGFWASHPANAERMAMVRQAYQSWLSAQ